tara:strand:+ start:3885 stop:4058 length:174 start_codon:yes stop_codon:yes gene_type:complete
VYNIDLTETELRYLYWRMKTNKWYERYKFASKRDNPWQEWMQATIDKLEPIYKKIDE